MKITFFKYQGTGNDFIIMDNRAGIYNELTTAQIKFMCNRRIGIGADGLMLLNQQEGYDFEMKYYNADGRESSMCGNGGRCLTKFASDIGLVKDDYYFIAIDGEHKASIEYDGTVSLKMADVNKIEQNRDDYIVNTGSPHYVKFADNIMHEDIVKKGRDIRNSPMFVKDGINVNFVEQGDEADKIMVRTYERGVEDETLSCGTGVTAAALVCSHNDNGFNRVEVKTLGGFLNVEYDKIGDSYKNIWLNGPAIKVFEGHIEL